MSNLLLQIVTGAFLLMAVCLTTAYTFEKFKSNHGWKRFLAPGYIVVFILVCLLWGVWTLALGPSGTLLALALAGGLCVSLFHPVSALSILIAVLLLRPWEINPDSAALKLVPRLFALVTLVAWFLSRFIRRRVGFVWNQSLSVLTLFFIWLVVCTLISPLGAEGAKAIFNIFLPIYIVCFLLVNSIETQTDMALVKNSVILSVTGVIVGAIVLTLGNPNPSPDGGLRLEGVGLNGNANDLASLAVLTFPFLIFSILKNRKNRAVPWWQWLSVLILGAGLLLSKSRAAVIALVASWLFYSWTETKSPKKFLLRLMGLGLLMIPFYFAIMQRDTSDLSESSASRLNYMLTGLRMLRDHPLLGVGTYNYENLYDQYSRSFLEAGTHVAHSTWITLLAETGLIGFALFTYLFFSIARKSWRLRKIDPQYICAILGYGITMSLLTQSYVFYPYLLMFMIATAYRVETA